MNISGTMDGSIALIIVLVLFLILNLLMELRLSNLVGAEIQYLGNSEDNYIIGNSGDNRIYGKGGDDVLFGGSDDNIKGGSGHDFDGEEGNDNVYGHVEMILFLQLDLKTLLQKILFGYSRITQVDANTNSTGKFL